MTDVLLTNYLSAVWAPCYHLLSPAPTFILHLHKTDLASTSEYLRVPQSTSRYFKVPRSTSKYFKVLTFILRLNLICTRESAKCCSTFFPWSITHQI